MDMAGEKMDTPVEAVVRPLTRKGDCTAPAEKKTATGMNDNINNHESF